jgi:hypothetical protein
MSQESLENFSQYPSSDPAIWELRNQQVMIDSEIENVKKQLTGLSENTKKSIESLENSMQTVRDMARDVMHISIGVDGKNGLRGVTAGLSEQVAVLAKEFGFLRQTADSYVEMRQTVLRYFATAAMGLFLQFAAAIWYFSGQHQQQQVLKDDLNKVLLFIEKQQQQDTSKVLK